MQILDKFLTKIEECESLAERAQTPDAKEKYRVLGRMWERLAVFRASGGSQDSQGPSASGR